VEEIQVRANKGRGTRNVIWAATADNPKPAASRN
jgi:hypothetical protein